MKFELDNLTRIANGVQWTLAKVHEFVIRTSDVVAFSSFVAAFNLASVGETSMSSRLLVVGGIYSFLSYLFRLDRFSDDGGDLKRPGTIVGGFLEQAFCPK